MKGGLAAMVIASIRAFDDTPPDGGIRIIFTAGEELGCQGASHLAGGNLIEGGSSAVIVGEPTANEPVTGHKGALYLNAITSGKSAHSSMPELGVNAIYKAAKAIVKISEFDFRTEKDPLLGFPTINVGKISGGMNLNSVPDHAEFTIDIRTTKMAGHRKILHMLAGELGIEVATEILVDLNPVYTPETDPFVRIVYDICGIAGETDGFPKSLPYLTDGAVLQKYYHNAPTVILGPGEPEMAHRTDEFCYIARLERSVGLYKEIILKWGNHDRVSG
jgi:succinyl-diaminopimelate desuccinylase